MKKPEAKQHRRTGRVILRETVERMTDYISRLSYRDLQLLAMRLEQLNETNCWWFEYNLREGLLEYLQTEKVHKSLRLARTGATLQETKP